MNPTEESVQEIVTYLSQKGFFKPNTDIDQKVFSHLLRLEAETVFKSEYSRPGSARECDRWDAIFLQYDKLGTTKNLTMEFCFVLNYKSQKVEILNINATRGNLTKSYGKSYAIGKDSSDTFPNLDMIEKDLEKSMSPKPRQFRPQKRDVGRRIR